MVAFIPSPSSGVVHLGPLQLHAYGFALALGILAAARIATRRWRVRGCDAQVLNALIVPVVVGGLVGARVYHLFTGYDWSRDGIVGTIEVWHGGLSIWGAVGGGALVLAYLAHRRHLDFLVLVDVLAPAIVVAQAIGRWGNYFNQELFGRPTTLPWAVRIELAHRPAGYTQFATFHPTFLYESLWCLAIYTVIVCVERTVELRRGQTFALYVALYTAGRTAFEVLRMDKATYVFGVRFNLLVSAALCIAGAVMFATRHGGAISPSGPPPSDPAASNSIGTQCSSAVLSSDSP